MAENNRQHTHSVASPPTPTTLSETSSQKGETKIGNNVNVDGNANDGSVDDNALKLTPVTNDSHRSDVDSACTSQEDASCIEPKGVSHCQLPSRCREPIHSIIDIVMIVIHD